MTRSEAGRSLFYQHSTPNLSIYLVVYLDDIINTRNDQDGFTNPKQYLIQHLQTRELG